jgi:hypothetical protein
VPFCVVGKILMSRIYWNLFGKIWIQNVGNIDFKLISAAENSKSFFHLIEFSMKILLKFQYFPHLRLNFF